MLPIEQISIIVGDRFEAKLVCEKPGDVNFVLTIDGNPEGTVPFDNIVKARTRIDAEHASDAEKQIKSLRAEIAHLRGQLVDEQVLRMRVSQAERALEMARHDPGAALSELAQVREGIPPRLGTAPEGMQTLATTVWTSTALTIADAAEEEGIEFGAFLRKILRDWANARTAA
jgi:TolA-binding protein